jgi:hypothetical protein
MRALSTGELVDHVAIPTVAMASLRASVSVSPPLPPVVEPPVVELPLVLDSPLVVGPALVLLVAVVSPLVVPPSPAAESPEPQAVAKSPSAAATAYAKGTPSLELGARADERLALLAFKCKAIATSPSVSLFGNFRIGGVKQRYLVATEDQGLLGGSSCNGGPACKK